MFKKNEKKVINLKNILIFAASNMMKKLLGRCGNGSHSIRYYQITEY